MVTMIGGTEYPGALNCEAIRLPRQLERILMVNKLGLHCCNVAAMAGLSAAGMVVAKCCAVTIVLVGGLIV